jgi:hypothetical protein
MDPDLDPGGPKTYVSDGSGSATLNFKIMSVEKIEEKKQSKLQNKILYSFDERIIILGVQLDIRGKSSQASIPTDLYV